MSEIVCQIKLVGPEKSLHIETIYRWCRVWHFIGIVINHDQFIIPDQAAYSGSALPLPRPLQIQHQQPLQNLRIGEIVRPGVDIQDGMVEHFGICEGDNRAGGTVAPGFQVTWPAFELLAVLAEALLAKRACGRAA